MFLYQDDIAWKSSNDVRSNCALFNSSWVTLEMVKCSTKLRYICKVRLKCSRSTLSVAAIIFQIEISFPDSCFHPYYVNTGKGQQEKAFHWKKSWTTTAASKKNYQIASSAITAKREQGKPFYFACGAKTYMGIMEEVCGGHELNALKYCNNYSIFSSSQESERLTVVSSVGCNYSASRH